MKKYEFYKIDNDNVGLKYKDKEFSFKVNVKLQRDLQAIIGKSRIKLLKYLSENGETVNDYVVVVKKNGKTYYDNSNKQALEEYFREQETIEYFNQFCLDNFKLEMVDLMTDIGLESEEEGSEFAKDFSNAMTGNIPSGKQADK